MAHRIAVDWLEKDEDANEVFVKLAYAIGHPEALMAVAVVDGTPQEVTGYDLTPNGIRSFLELNNPIYSKTAEWGHFGRGFTWK